MSRRSKRLAAFLVQFPRFGTRAYLPAERIVLSMVRWGIGPVSSQTRWREYCKSASVSHDGGKHALRAYFECCEGTSPTAHLVMYRHLCSPHVPQRNRKNVVGCYVVRIRRGDEIAQGVLYQLSQEIFRHVVEIAWIEIGTASHRRKYATASLPRACLRNSPEMVVWSTLIPHPGYVIPCLSGSIGRIFVRPRLAGREFGLPNLVVIVLLGTLTNPKPTGPPERLRLCADQPPA